MINVSSDEEDRRIVIILRLRTYRSKVAEYQAGKELYDSLYPSCVQHLTDMPTSRSDTFEPERWAMKRETQAERMQRSLDAMRDAMTDVEQMLDTVDGDHRTVLVRRYLLNESWEVIAEKMHYCARSVRYMHQRAIDKVCQFLPDQS